jgi:hypothetical protein
MFIIYCSDVDAKLGTSDVSELEEDDEGEDDSPVAAVFS